MGWVPAPPILQLVKFCLIGFVCTVQGSAGSAISPAPSVFSGIPPMEEAPGPVYERKPLTSNVPSSESQPIESNSHPSFSSPPLVAPYHSPPFIPAPSYTAPPPLHLQGEIPSSSHSISVVSPYIAPSPGISERHLSPLAPNASQRTAASPALAPSKNLTLNAPESSPIQPSAPESSPPSSHQPNIWSNGSPVPNPTAPGPDHAFASPPVIGKKRDGVPVATPPNEPTKPLPAPPENHSPTKAPPPISGRKRNGVPIASPPSETSSLPPPVNHTPIKAPPPMRVKKTDRVPVAAPPYETSKPLPPANHSPVRARSTHKSMRHSNDAPAPSLSSSNTPMNNGYLTPASSPFIPSHKQNHTRSKLSSHAPGSPYVIPPPPKQQGPVIPPSSLPTNRQTHYAPPPRGLDSSGSSLNHSITKPKSNVQSAPSPSPTAASGWTKMPVLSPKVSPSGSSSRIPKMPFLPPVQAFPPPPPNEDCSTTVCTEPYTNTPPNSPCGCVLPMQVGLRLSVALYTFFPLVSELAQEIAAGVFMKQSQVRIMGATAASQQPEKTIVLIDLVPLGEKFDNTTAFLTYQRFWHKQVVINVALFGDYEVLYVNYTGLPASPPLPPSIDIIDDGPYSGNGNNARSIKPLGVDVPKKEHKNRLGGGVIAIIALSASIALVLCSAVAWVVLFRPRGRNSQPVASQPSLPPSIAKPSGTTGSVMGSGLTSASLSFGSSIAPYTGSAKTFSASDIERATNNFNASRVLGEGGFGRVYSGVLEDGTEVAVKVLKRDDQQGSREFLAEVEMLSRLHHRNLVKLIGICTEEHARCLVYELIPNGSVESHLHGVDKHAAPLDWDARLKIALGAARALAYLHEDSSPRVIHRDFKASNILLEHEFTPKVSDFGLARTALDEENRHISTRVMGTFGYVAPEYAMTGHLLVKSDVYSYGVVLLELLTGRKPVNMSQPSGQENLVAWARPLLTTKEGLEAIIDPFLVSEVPFDSVAKVAAIASMCVQPEVSHRPFMGEVVQALKLVCNECDEAKEVDLRSSSEELSVDVDAGASACSGQLPDPFRDHSLVSPNYDSEPDMESGLSASDLFSASVRHGRQGSGSFERCSSSGPIRTGRGRQWWQSKRRLTGGSVSEHGISFRLWPGSH